MSHPVSNIENPTLAWLGEQCTEAMLAEKWLLVDEARIGQHWKERLTLSGRSHINLRVKTMHMLVSELAGPVLAAEAITLASRLQRRLLMQSTLRRLAERNALEYFSPLPASLAGLSDLLIRTYDDLQLAECSPKDIQESDLEVAAKARDLFCIFDAFAREMTSRRWLGPAGSIHLVLDLAGHGHCELPRDLRILEPEVVTKMPLERRLLEVLARLGCQWLTPACCVGDSTDHIPLQVTAAAGEINEVRHAFRCVLSNLPTASPLDTVEIVTSDSATYVPLIIECLMRWLGSRPGSDRTSATTTGQMIGLNELPATFGEGVACIYSRPGRLLRSWIRWAAMDGIQTKAVQILREGLLIKPSRAEEIGYSRLANTLRRVAIGFGLDRYEPQIVRELSAARYHAEQFARAEAFYADEDRSPAVPQAEPRIQSNDFGALALESVLAMIGPLASLAPRPGQSDAVILDHARQLLSAHARADNAIDRYARARLIDDIDGMQRLVQAQPDSSVDVLAWLEDLPLTSRMLASGPRPGCLHVSPLTHGGAIGRPNVFLLGMDDRRLPLSSPVDPILLDNERTRLSNQLPTSEQRTQLRLAHMLRILQRLEGVASARVHLTYSTRSLANDQVAFASPCLLKSPWNAASKSAGLAGFLSRDTRHWLHEEDGRLLGYLAPAPLAHRQQRLMQEYPHLKWREAAVCRVLDPSFNAHDGLVPTAGRAMQERMQQGGLSPSRLELLAACPRRFFFQTALQIMPPVEWIAEPDRWLSPLQLGSFVHELFEDFLRELAAAGLVPEPTRDHARLLVRLEEQLERWQLHVPVHDTDAYLRQRDELFDYCDIFLHKEAEYFHRTGAQPWVMEACLGGRRGARDASPTSVLDTDMLISIPIPGGRQLKLSGRIDRVDRLPGPSDDAQDRYMIWDYKTGSDFGYANQKKLLSEGRKLQPLLYVRMLQQRLTELGHSASAVQGFGYFFPSPKCEGRRIELQTETLAPGDAIVGQLIDLLEAGAFIATNSKEDCAYCDYQSVCGPVDDLVELSNLKSTQTENVALKAWRQLRSTGQRRSSSGEQP